MVNYEVLDYCSWDFFKIKIQIDTQITQEMDTQRSQIHKEKFIYGSYLQLCWQQKEILKWALQILDGRVVCILDIMRLYLWVVTKVPVVMV